MNVKVYNDIGKRKDELINQEPMQQNYSQAQ